MFLSFYLEGCRLRAPTIGEQQELISRGAFGRGVPQWVASPSIGGSPDLARTGSVIPQQFEVPEFASTPESNYQAAQEIKKLEDKKREDDKDKQKAEPLGEDAQAEKILKKCPHAEGRLHLARGMSDPRERLDGLYRVASVCRDSEELWLWIGNVHRTLSENAEANRSYERSLILNPNNKQAKEALDSK